MSSWVREMYSNLSPVARTVDWLPRVIIGNIKLNSMVDEKLDDSRVAAACSDM